MSVKKIVDFPEFYKLYQDIVNINDNIQYDTHVYDVCDFYSQKQLNDVRGAIGWFGTGSSGYPNKAYGMKLTLVADLDTINKLIHNENLGFPKEMKRTEEKTLMEVTQGLQYYVNKKQPKIINTHVVPKKIIKNKYFDTVFNAMKQVNPEFTEEELIGEYEDHEGYIRFNYFVVDNIIQEKKEYEYEENNLYELIIIIAYEFFESNRQKAIDIIKEYTSML